MERHQIRYFLALCETLNFTKAAAACNVSQPSLTRAIRNLEEELGGLLFSRERRNTHLTELGRLVEPHLAEVAAQTDEAKYRAAAFMRLENANLTVGVMCTIAPVQFVTFLSRFRTEHPGIEVTLVESVPDRLCELLTTGGLDVALMARPTGFPARLRPTHLYSERFVIACSAGHRFARQNEVRLPELDGEFYFTRINCEFRDVLADACANAGAKLNRSYRSEREDWILNMVAAGLGICFLPEFAAVFPGVVGCPVSPPITRDVVVATVAGRRQSAPLAAFVQALRRHAWTQPHVAINDDGQSHRSRRAS